MSDVTTEETAPELDPEIWDENGMARPGKNVYSPEYAPTTTFHPYELPAHPAARAAFPRELINDGEWTQSPASDVPPEHRQRVGEQALRDQEEWLKAQQAEYEDTLRLGREHASLGTPAEKATAEEEATAAY